MKARGSSFKPPSPVNTSTIRSHSRGDSIYTNMCLIDTFLVAQSIADCVKSKHTAL